MCYEPQARGNQEVFNVSRYLSDCSAHYKHFTCNVGEKICDYSFVSVFDLLALLKIVVCMPKSTHVHQKTKTRPSHHDKSVHAIIWTSFAFKWIDEVNDHCIKQPSHVSNYIRVYMIPFIVSTHTPKRKQVFKKFDNRCWLC